MPNQHNLLGSKEAIDYLQVSTHKFKKLINEDILIPYSETKGRYGNGAYLFLPEDLMKVKKILKQENYKYAYA